MWWLNNVAERKEKESGTPFVEWLTGGAGALIFAAIVGILLTNAVSNPAGPPDIVVAVERVVPVSNGYVVAFVARNDGDTTAAMVEISGEGSVETHRAMLDYLPPRSERRGGLFFAADPRASGVVLRAEGYQDP